jgi:hypothetical protein
MKKQILKTLELYLENLNEWENLEDVKEDIESTKAQIEYMKAEIRKDAAREYIDHLKAFQNHMSNTFEVLMGDNCTDETCTNFYNSDFQITWRGKTVTLYNGAEVFQSIESIIESEIDDNEEA